MEHNYKYTLSELRESMRPILNSMAERTLPACRTAYTLRTAFLRPNYISYCSANYNE